MYESIKYEELKNLPDDQKKIALQELMTTYGSNSEIAKATGTVAIAIANMYGKVVEGKHVGRTKGSKNTIDTKKEELPEATIETESSINVTEIKPKRKYTKKVRPDVEVQQEVVKQEELLQEPQNQEIVRTPIKLAELSVSFATSLNGELSGVDIKERVAGMINALLNDKRYTINLQIDEQ